MTNVRDTTAEQQHFALK